MRRNLLIGCFAVLCALVPMQTAWSAVTGSWDVTGTETVSVSIKGYGSQRMTEEFVDVFDIQDGGIFQMTYATGTWTQKKNKFRAVLDSDDLEFSFEELFYDMAGLDVDVTKAAGSVSGTEKRNGTIKGKFTISLTFYSWDYEIYGKAKAKGSFIGVRTTDGALALDFGANRGGSTHGPQLLRSIAEMVKLGLSPSAN
jgi:hypothetical protein